MLSAIRYRVRGVPSWVIWTVLALIGLFIMILNDVLGDEDGFIVFGLIYMIILVIAVTRWVFLQVKSVIALKRDKAKMEMLHLKSQVNPHFFFNTLNNLYGLVDKDPKEAQSLILKLSEMMRYSIYEGQQEWVPLEDEISYLQNYVDLHKNRYHKKVTINFTTSIDKKGYRIMPLLLILVVENAFKHGVEKLRDDAFVTIELEARQDEIHFSILNNYDSEEVDNQEAGIGMANLKRRLEIGYKKDFDLSIANEDEIFNVQLSLRKV